MDIGKIVRCTKSSFRNYTWGDDAIVCIYDLGTWRSFDKMISYIESLGWNYKVFEYAYPTGWSHIQDVAPYFSYCPRVFASKQILPDYINHYYSGTMTEYYANLINSLNILLPCLANLVIHYL